MAIRIDRHCRALALGLTLAAHSLAPVLAQAGSPAAGVRPGETKATAQRDPRSAQWFPQGVRTLPAELFTTEGIFRLRRQKWLSQMNALGPLGQPGGLGAANAPGSANRSNPIGPANGGESMGPGQGGSLMDTAGGFGPSIGL